MPRYLDTRGKPSVAIAVCDRCNAKVAYSDLRPDGNTPGLRVCQPCWDSIDPYKLPIPRQEKISLRHPRPDVSIAVED